MVQPDFRAPTPADVKGSIRQDNLRFADPERWEHLTAADLIEQAVQELAAVFRAHVAFLRSIILISGVHPEIRRRGSSYSHEIGEQFSTLILRSREQIDHPQPEAAASSTFNSVFSSLVLRTMYGPGFATPAEDDETFIAALSAMARRYLLAPLPHPHRGIAGAAEKS